MTRDGTVGRSDATEPNLASHWDIDPVRMMRTRFAYPIRASSPPGLHQQAGHMTASDLCAARWEMKDPDTYWHVMTERWIIAHGDVPRVDVFSHTAAGTPWIDGEWLSQVVMAVTYDHAGWLGLHALLIACVVATYAIICALMSSPCRCWRCGPGCSPNRGETYGCYVRLWFCGLMFTARLFPASLSPPASATETWRTLPGS